MFWQWDRGRLPDPSAASPAVLRHERRRCSECCLQSPPDAALQCLLGPDPLPALLHLAGAESTWIKASRARRHQPDSSASARSPTASLEADAGSYEVVHRFPVCDDDYSTRDPRPPPSRDAQQVLCGESHRFACGERHRAHGLRLNLWCCVLGRLNTKASYIVALLNDPSQFTQIPSFKCTLLSAGGCANWHFADPSVPECFSCCCCFLFKKPKSR